MGGARVASREVGQLPIVSSRVITAYKKVLEPPFFIAESVRTPLIESPTYLICHESPNIDGGMVY